MSFENDEREDEVEREEEEEEENDGTFDLIRKVEGRPFIYNSRDPKHSKRDVINDAWNDIAKGLLIKGKRIDGASCRKKWKTLRDYYYKVKKTVKGKSGDGAKDKKPWMYFAAMDRVLSSYVEENENTQSNFPGDDSSNMENQSPPNSDCVENDKDHSEESTPTGTSSSRRVSKRKFDAKADANEKAINEKILKVLEEPEEVKDQYYHFGMTICNRLRSLPTQTSEYAMLRITSMLYEIMYPPHPWENQVNQQANPPTTDESTRYEQL